MSALSDYLNAHIPAGWSKPDVIRTIVQAEPAQPGAARNPDVKIGEVRGYIAELRATGQDELVDRLEASLDTTSSASHTVNKSPNT